MRESLSLDKSEKGGTAGRKYRPSSGRAAIICKCPISFKKSFAVNISEKPFESCWVSKYSLKIPSVFNNLCCSNSMNILISSR